MIAEPQKTASLDDLIRAVPPAFNPARRFSMLGELAILVGEGAAEKLVRKFGGRRVYIPRAPVEGEVLVRLVGITAALKLARIFGGERVMLPADPDRRLRRDRIVALRGRQLSVAEIARTMRVTERYVYKVLADARQA
ncbi:MAG TPA: hypothetical protein VEC38_10220 [Candidatus Binataceae bacterium]|nr:hypothetical protein [Candidatus Binataceae bacterium]